MLQGDGDAQHGHRAVGLEPLQPPLQFLLDRVHRIAVAVQPGVQPHMLPGVDRLLGDEGPGVLRQLAGQLGPVVAHRIHEQALPVRKGQGQGVEHRRRHRIPAHP